LINLREHEGLCTAVIQEMRLRLSANGCESAATALLVVFRTSVNRQRQIPSLTIALASVVQDAACVAGMDDSSGLKAEAVIESALACDRLDRESVRVLTFNLVETYVRDGAAEQAVEVVERLEWPEYRLELAVYFGKRLHDMGYHIAGEMLLSLLPEEDVANARLDTYTCELDQGQYTAALRTACFIPTKRGELVSLLNSEAGRNALGGLAMAQALNQRCGKKCPPRIES
jgi:hypothetical protein